MPTRIWRKSTILMNNEILLLSLRPRYADAVFEGAKGVELRRTRPRVTNGSRVLVYASGPISSLVGVFVVENVIKGTPRTLWPQVKDSCGISRSEYLKYFSGAESAFGIVIKETHPLEKQVPLRTLNAGRCQFRPPQCYHYIDEQKAEKLAGCRMPA